MELIIQETSTNKYLTFFDFSETYNSSENYMKLLKDNSVEDFSEYTELNELTLKTLEDSKKGIGVKSHKNLELLYKDLGI